MPHVLIAEDDEASRALLRKYLESAGFQVTAVADGQAALDAVGPKFDLVILDVMMPKLTGFDVLKRARDAGQTVPIIMATAAAGPSDTVRALELGADDYVTKPYSFPVLLARMQARMRARPTPVPKPPALPKRKSDDGGLLGRIKAVATRIKAGPQAPTVLERGTKLGDRYVVDTRLGAGGFGAVYRARHVDLQHDVAVKVLSPHGQYGTVEALRREAQAASQVRHPHAVRVFDFGPLPPKSAFLVMELLDGPTLDATLTRKGTLEPGLALGILRAVLGALGAAHKQGLVHRDVKPANVMLHREDDREVPKLLDFGAARLLDEPDEEDALVGSPAYLSPERLRGDDYDGRADVYACGVMLYKLLTGALPLEGHTADFEAMAKWHLEIAPTAPSKRNPAVSKGLDALVLRLLAKQPAQRPATDEAQSLIDSALWG